MSRQRRRQAHRRAQREQRTQQPLTAREIRLDVIDQHLAAYYPLADAQRAAARHARSTLGLVPISDLEAHYLPELGLTPLETP